MKPLKPNDLRYTRPQEIKECLDLRNKFIFPEIDMFSCDPCAAYQRETAYCELSLWPGKTLFFDGWDALESEWAPGDYFVNPPFSQLKYWCKKIVDVLSTESEFRTSITVIIPNTALERKYVHELTHSSFAHATENLKGRRPFIHPDTLEEMKRPPFGITVIVLSNALHL